jgi:diaminopimelate epimerase
MEGTGNDFVVIDNREANFTLAQIVDLTPKLCNRRFGVGADGLLALQPANRKGVDFTMIYRNADGSDAGMCGNGARCLAMFAAHHGFEHRQIFNVHEAVYRAEVSKMEHLVSVHFPDVEAPRWIELEGTKLIQLHPGTEHVVCFTSPQKLDDIQELLEMGRTIRNHANLNPPGTNVNFVCAEGLDSLKLQTYERGVEDFTLACGTGAMASAIAHHFISGGEAISKQNINIQVKGGNLRVSFVFDEANKRYTNLTLKGSAHFVYEGSINT